MHAGQYSEGSIEMRLTHDLVIQCSSCGSVHIVDRDGLDQRSFQEEHQMGLEVTHELYGDLECSGCGTPMRFSLVLSEYSAGAYNYHTHVSDGCEFVFDPSVELVFQDLDWLSMAAEDEVKSSIDETMETIEAARSGSRAFDEMTPREFEVFVAEVFRRSGYNVQLTPQTRDGGADIIVSHSVGGVPYVLLVECKRYEENRPISVAIVREAYGVMEDSGANKCAIVTTSRYSPDAKAFAERHAHRIQLMGIRDLVLMADEWRDRD